MDLKKAEEEPDDAPEWIEQLDGTYVKPGYYRWEPKDWAYHCILCKYSGMKADESHVNSEGHQGRLTWKLGDMWECNYGKDVRRIVKNPRYNFLNPHNFAEGSEASGSAQFLAVGDSPSSTPGPEENQVRLRSPPPAPPGLGGVPAEDIRSLREAVVDLTGAVQDVKATIEDQGRAMREFTARHST